jgi:hypothetical protein
MADMRLSSRSGSLGIMARNPRSNLCQRPRQPWRFYDFARNINLKPMQGWVVEVKKTAPGAGAGHVLSMPKKADRLISN